ncbi:MAG: GGDEF domain-containing protein [Eubacteriales bacterium]
MQEKVKQSYTWFALAILMIVLYFGWYQFSSAVAEAEMYAEGLNYIEYLNSSTQRVVKLEMNGTPNEELVYHLNNIIDELESADIYEETMFRKVEEIDELVADMKADWNAIHEEIEHVRNGEDIEKLLFASERHYNTTTELTIITTEKFTEVSAKITAIQIALMILIGMISIIIFRHLYSTFIAFKHARELTERMFIDVSTGLYNRSKCQEMLKDTNTPANHKARIMIIMDLNDLKITNDRLGHQVGDELIGSFATILRKASDIHDYKIFVGRYGGDEFMVYYQSADEMEAKLYLEEVNYLIEAFNVNEKKFQISYAAGYAVFTKEKDTLTMQDLFNAADAAMYENKVEMKAKKRALEYAKDRVAELEGQKDKSPTVGSDKSTKGNGGSLDGK